MLKKLFFGFAAMALTVSVWAQKTPAGYDISEANCASGGNHVYFFEDGTVISSYEGCEVLSVQKGTWTMSGKKVKVRYTKRFYNAPDGERIADGSNCDNYEAYKAASENLNEEDDFDWYDGIAFEESDDCGQIEKHEYFDNSDVYQFLRTSFVGKYDASVRLLTESELKKYSAYELKIMRNEIFARYGFKFTTKEMKDYFGKQSGYIASMNEVSPFLSDIETKNIATIKKVEATKK